MLAVFLRWSRSSEWLGALFLMVLVPSATTLVWLGVQLLEQDRRLWADLERRESAADVVVQALSQKLAAAEGELAEHNLSEGGLFARFTRTL